MAARAVYPKRFKMLLRAISLMLRKAELGKLLVQLPHDPIPGDLGDDASCRDGKRESVSFYDGVMGKRKIADWQAINQAVVGLRA